ncbi:MAG: hypothetical protein R3C28_10480 [Pirellulaceae bacterium]
MASDALRRRGQALEDAFFAAKDRQLLDQLRDHMKEEQCCAVLKQATGISSEVVLKELLAAGINELTITAVGMIPLVQVAWADRSMNEAERNAVLEAANQSGISQEHAAYPLLLKWLEHRPADSLYATWADYIEALKNTLDAGSFQALSSDIVQRIEAVAEAAGGILGIGKVSQVEREAIESIAGHLS